MVLFHGLFSGLPWWGGLLTLLALALTLGFFGSSFFAWTVVTVVSFWLLGVPKLLVVIVGAVMIAANFPMLRQRLLSANIMNLLNALKIMPKISETEKIALEAGTTWVDADLFSGRPDFDRLMTEPYQKLNEKEQRFLDVQCEELCRMTNDDRTYEDGDLPPEVWDYLRKEKFFGLIIPEEYGGLGFSALAHSEIVCKLGTRSIPLSISCMVPNSLGPAELLVHYGTDEQKSYYLPRLARGEEIPCFGLTEPGAGSDAGAMQSTATIFKGDDGKLCLRLQWRKRYITLAGISTVIGLAVKLFDPDNLLGKGKDLGITCVLVPSNAKGVVLGRRHDPLGVPFFNCPTEGLDVVVSIDQIIGGVNGAGQGWRMLMECLAAGRSISLPAQSTGGAKKLARVAGAYAQIRQQFGLPISKFEGVGEALARIGGIAYLLEACRIYTASAVDKGLKPSVISAIAKYESTELARLAMTDAMDIFGGAGISQGPNNIIARGYIAAPIGITVEGANILTRTMIIFGQGAIRCHPYAYKEVTALANNDLVAFDQAFWGHIRHIVRNTCRSFLLSITRGRLARVPQSPMARYYRKLAWTSSSFAILADIAMGSLGGSLKFKEKLTGRFADILSWMYLITAVLRRYEAEGRREDHAAFVHFAAQYGFVRIDRAFEGIFLNMDIPVLGKFFFRPLALWSRLNGLASEPSDKITAEIAKAMTQPGAVRDALTARAVYIPEDLSEPVARLEEAFKLSCEAQGIFRKINKAIKEKVVSKGKVFVRLDEAKAKGVITQAEVDMLRKAKEVCEAAVEVDSFPIEKYKKGVVNVWQGEERKKARA